MANAVKSLLTFSFGPSLSAIAITLLLALSLPLLLHLWIYRTRAPTSLPAFLIVGPSGAGKTSLLTLFERGDKPAVTHISQAPLTAECSLPVDTVAASARYRSINDPTNQTHKRFFLIDTPGHGKLRTYATTNIVNPSNLKGIIFMVDASTLSMTKELADAAEGGLTESAQFLHDVLSILQNRYTSAKSSKGPAEMPVLICANKLDLFTSMPADMVVSALEKEISKLRVTKSKGLLDSGVGMSDEADEDREVLGGGGEGKFEFKLMEEYNVPVTAAGAVVNGLSDSDVEQIWQWIAQQL